MGARRGGARPGLKLRETGLDRADAGHGGRGGYVGRSAGVCRDAVPMSVISALDVLSVLRQAARSRRAMRDEIISTQNARLRRLIAHASANVPYYRNLFERHGVEPGQIRTIADLDRLPVTSRRDLQTAPPPALLASGVDPTRLIVHHTSGSTGEPLLVRRTWLEERMTSVFRMRALRD